MSGIFFPVLFSSTFLFPSITIAQQTDLQNQYQSSSSILLATNDLDEHDQNKIFSTEIKKTRNRYQPFLEIGGAKYFHQSSTAAGVYDLFIPLLQIDDQLLFTDLRIFDRSGSQFEGNAHLGYRKLYPATNQMVGVYGAFDHKTSDNNNHFKQLTFGFEYWQNRLFVGGNAYKPIGITKKSISVFQTESTLKDLYLNPDLTAKIQRNTSQSAEKALGGIDTELGYAITDSLTGYAGGYYFAAPDVNTVAGPKIRLTYDYAKTTGRILGILDGINLEIGAQHDKPRGYSGYIGIKLKIGLTGFEHTSNVQGFAKRMVEPVRRDHDIVYQNTRTPYAIYTRIIVAPLTMQDLRDCHGLNEKTTPEGLTAIHLDLISQPSLRSLDGDSFIIAGSIILEKLLVGVARISSSIANQLKLYWDGIRNKDTRRKTPPMLTTILTDMVKLPGTQQGIFLYSHFKNLISVGATQEDLHRARREIYAAYNTARKSNTNHPYTLLLACHSTPTTTLIHDAPTSASQLLPPKPENEPSPSSPSATRIYTEGVRAFHDEDKPNLLSQLQIITSSTETNNIFANNTGTIDIVAPHELSTYQYSLCTNDYCNGTAPKNTNIAIHRELLSYQTPQIEYYRIDGNYWLNTTNTMVDITTLRSCTNDYCYPDQFPDTIITLTPPLVRNSAKSNNTSIAIYTRESLSYPINPILFSCIDNNCWLNNTSINNTNTTNTLALYKPSADLYNFCTESSYQEGFQNILLSNNACPNTSSVNHNQEVYTDNNYNLFKNQPLTAKKKPVAKAQSPKIPENKKISILQQEISMFSYYPVAKSDKIIPEVFNLAGKFIKKSPPGSKVSLSYVGTPPVIQPVLSIIKKPWWEATPPSDSLNSIELRFFGSVVEKLSANKDFDQIHLFVYTILSDTNLASYAVGWARYYLYNTENIPLNELLPLIPPWLKVLLPTATKAYMEEGDTMETLKTFEYYATSTFMFEIITGSIVFITPTAYPLLVGLTAHEISKNVVYLLDETGANKWVSQKLCDWNIGTCTDPNKWWDLEIKPSKFTTWFNYAITGGFLAYETYRVLRFFYPLHNH